MPAYAHGYSACPYHPNQSYPVHVRYQSPVHHLRFPIKENPAADRGSTTRGMLVRDGQYSRNRPVQDGTEPLAILVEGAPRKAIVQFQPSCWLPYDIPEPDFACVATQPSLYSLKLVDAIAATWPASLPEPHEQYVQYHREYCEHASDHVPSELSPPLHSS